MPIGTRVPLRTEHGLQLFVERYCPLVPEQSVTQIVLALGYFDDVEDDPTVPIEGPEVAELWTRRQPELITHLSRSAPWR